MQDLATSAAGGSSSGDAEGQGRELAMTRGHGLEDGRPLGADGEAVGGRFRRCRR